MTATEDTAMVDQLQVLTENGALDWFDVEWDEPRLFIQSAMSQVSDELQLRVSWSGVSVRVECRWAEPHLRRRRRGEWVELCRVRCSLMDSLSDRYRSLSPVELRAELARGLDAIAGNNGYSLMDAFIKEGE